MRKRFLIFLMTVSAAIGLTACEPESYDTYCSISGTVIESGTNEPIQGVTNHSQELISTEWFGTSMSARHILGLEKVPRVRLFAD